MDGTVMGGLALVLLLAGLILWRRFSRTRVPPVEAEMEVEVEAVPEPPPQRPESVVEAAAAPAAEPEAPPTAAAPVVGEAQPSAEQPVETELSASAEERVEAGEAAEGPAAEAVSAAAAEIEAMEEEAAVPAAEDMQPVAVLPEDLPELLAEAAETIPAIAESEEPAEVAAVLATETEVADQAEGVALPEIVEPPEDQAAAQPEPEPPEAVRERGAEPEEGRIEEPSPAVTPVAAVEETEPAPEVEEASRVAMTIGQYAQWLNTGEERQRTLLDQAIRQGDDSRRDQLQRELVIMNDKLSLLADSYEEELVRFRQALDTLDLFQGEVDDAALEAAKRQLQAGDPQAAEELYLEASGRPSIFAARAAFQSGQLAESRVNLETALDRYRIAVEREPENPRYLHAAGKVARSLYRYRDAQAWLERYIRLLREQPTTAPVEFALAIRDLAYTFVLSGQYQKAGPLYKESMTLLARELGQDHPEMAASWYQIGELQETLGEYDKAVSLYRKALGILEAKRGKDHPVLAAILDRLAALCMELELEKEAVPLYERLVAIREKALRSTHPQLTMSLNNLAESYRLQGRYAEAESCYRRSLVINEETQGKDHPGVAAILQELAKLCSSQRKEDEARSYRERADAIFRKSVDESESRAGSEALTLEI